VTKSLLGNWVCADSYTYLYCLHFQPVMSLPVGMTSPARTTSVAH